MLYAQLNPWSCTNRELAAAVMGHGLLALLLGVFSEVDGEQQLLVSFKIT